MKIISFDCSVFHVSSLAHAPPVPILSHANAPAAGAAGRRFAAAARPRYGRRSIFCSVSAASAATVAVAVAVAVAGHASVTCADTTELTLYCIRAVVTT